MSYRFNTGHEHEGRQISSVLTVISQALFAIYQTPGYILSAVARRRLIASGGSGITWALLELL